MTDTATPSPLSGLKVVEFTHMVMGPTVGAILASLGAQVTRVEPIGGDRTRDLRGSGAGYFPMYNRHKSSICLDLKHPSGKKVARELIEDADILVENYRPGAMDRLGLGYEDCSASNSRLIYSSQKGFLPGPYENRTALDEVAQMMGGLAYMTGPPGQPLRAGASVIDVTGGMFGVIGILAAVEERHRTGKGQKVQSSLFETTAYLVGQHMAQLAVTGASAKPMPVRVSAWAIYDVFETKDEPLFIGIVTDALWKKFCDIFDFEELWSDGSLRENNARVAARGKIMQQVCAIMKTMTKAEIIAKLDGTGIPFAPISKPDDLFNDPHLIASGALEKVNMPDGTQTALPALPIEMDGQLVARDASLSTASANAAQILTELGYSEEGIKELVADGATQIDQ
ncbi:MAG: CaiB/BaiF CoA-transferase family protein [Erythrobacter sp.]|uniref:CaiB/BaiF CoA transferase family protein n=1 Tax=Erythrobacter sp. TaxID=1042 RepID=UPI003298E8B7